MVLNHSGSRKFLGCAIALIGLSLTGAMSHPAWADSAVPKVPTVVKVPWPQLSNAERSFDLPACVNCRQLGGLPARGGYVRRDRLYRTDGLFQVDNRMLSKIEQMGWRVSIDLRTPGEWRDNGYDNLPRVPWWQLWKPRCRNVFLHMNTWYPGPEPMSCYRTIMCENKASMADFFNTLSQESNYPLVFHCTAGKDRTGVTAALTLALLGTPRPIIFSDFLYSRHNNMEVNADDLLEVFAILDADYNGSVHQYLESLGVKKSTLKRIPELLIDSGDSKY